MSPTAEQVRDMVLSKAGFLKRDGSRRDGLIDVREAETQVDTQLRYGGLFREMAIESTSSDLVYETPSSGQSPGTPCIYLKVLSDPSPHSVGGSAIEGLEPRPDTHPVDNFRPRRKDI